MANDEQEISGNIEIGGNVGAGAAVGHGAKVKARIIAGGSVQFNVPPPVPPDIPPHFVGREQELLELRHLLSHNYAESIVTMTGLPGIGKTTLAMVAANHLAYVYRDGCLWTNMVEYTGRPTALLKRFIAHYWQETPDINEPDSLTELLRQFLASKRVLIVADHLDDVEDLKYLKKLVSAGRSTLLVVTNHETVTQQMSPTIFEVNSLTDDDAFRLLKQQSQYQVEPTDENIRKLMRRSLNHPATLIQIAVQMRHSPNRRLEEWVASLESIPLASVDPEEFAAAVYRNTYKLLSAEQQRLLRLLGILGQAKYRPDALAAILGLPKEHVLTDLSVLTDVSLLSNRNNIEPLPYTFAHTTALASDDFENLWREAQNYYLQWFIGFTEAEQFQDAEDELKHIRLLFSQAVERNDWGTVNLYHDKLLSVSRLGYMNIIAGQEGHILKAEPSIPFPNFNLYTEGGAIANVNLQGGLGGNLYSKGGMFSHLQLAGAVFANIYVEGGVFVNCDLRGATLHTIYVENGAFLNCDLRGATIHTIYVENGVFANCDLRNAILSDLVLRNSKATSIDARGAVLSNVDVDRQSIMIELYRQGAEIGKVNVDGVLYIPDEWLE